MVKKSTKSSSRKKKKVWFEMIAPAEFGDKQLGLIPLYEETELGERTLKIPLSELTGDYKQQEIKVTLKLVAFKGKKILTELMGFQLGQSSLKRAVRKEKSRGDLSSMFKTSDQDVQIKTLFVTRTKTSGSVIRALTNKLQETLQITLAKVSYQDFVSSFIKHNIQYELKKALSKIYPVTYCEIRSVKKV